MNRLCCSVLGLLLSQYNRGLCGASLIKTERWFLPKYFVIIGKWFWCFKKANRTVLSKLWFLGRIAGNNYFLKVIVKIGIHWNSEI